MMKLIAAVTLTIIFSLPLCAAIVTQPVEYADEKGTALHGYVVYDDAITGKRPGVIVVHDWRGLSDYTKMRSEMLAKLGYIAFAADIYGKDIHTDGPAAWMKEITIYKSDRDLYRERERAAYQAFLKEPLVDPTPWPQSATASAERA